MGGVCARRPAHAQRPSRTGRRRSPRRNTLEEPSFSAFSGLLAHSKPTTYLDHLVLYIITRKYKVGVIIVVPAEPYLFSPAATWEQKARSTSCWYTATTTTSACAGTG